MTKIYREVSEIPKVIKDWIDQEAAKAIKLICEEGIFTYVSYYGGYFYIETVGTIDPNKEKDACLYKTKLLDELSEWLEDNNSVHNVELLKKLADEITGIAKKYE